MTEGVIVKGIGGFYYVKSGNDVIECKARGKFRKDEISPIVGDHVLVEIKNGKGSIEKIFERKNFLIRPSVSNIDTLVVVASAAKPSPSAELIDKFLIMGEINNIETVIMFTKTDLESVDELYGIYKNAGYRVISACAKSGEGKDEVIELFKGKITALAGNSGVGKSSLLNMVYENLNLKTGEISEKLNRGRHTTRHVELLQLGEETYVLDTPGFSSFEIPEIEASELENCYREFRDYIGLCRFNGCSHINEPDCAVKEALGEGRISSERYKNYCELYEKLKNVKKWKK